MKKTIIKILDFIISLLFPTNSTLQKNVEIVSSIAKLTNQKGDKVVDYPCPAYSFFAYRNPDVRNMIWRLKYRGDITVAKIFADEMYNQFCEELTELSLWANFKEPILIPIPISKNKLRLRGFNQSAALCKALSTLDENRFFNYMPNVLYKIKDTNSQARVKDRTARLKNLKDSFEIKDTILQSGFLQNKNIILLDDVLTTGSTLTEATETLKKAGVGNIIWVVIAH